MEYRLSSAATIPSVFAQCVYQYVGMVGVGFTIIEWTSSIGDSDTWTSTAMDLEEALASAFAACHK
jgi:hypothetical protein